MESYKIKVLEVRKISENATTLVLERPEGFKFISGQHVLLALSGESAKPFSFSNSPTAANIEITIKKVGEQTSKFQEVQPETIIEMKGPFKSTLEFDENVKQDVVLISGGSGIYPFMSMLKYAIEKKLPNKFIVLNSNKTSDDIDFEKELEDFKNKIDLKVVHTLTRNTDESWKGQSGRIDLEMIKKYVGDLSNKVFYICSIPQMVIHIKKLLLDGGIPEENVR